MITLVRALAPFPPDSLSVSLGLGLWDQRFVTETSTTKGFVSFCWKSFSTCNMPNDVVPHHRSAEASRRIGVDVMIDQP